MVANNCCMLNKFAKALNFTIATYVFVLEYKLLSMPTAESGLRTTDS